MNSIINVQYIDKESQKEITEQQLSELQEQVKEIEQEKAVEEKKLKSEVSKNENKIKSLKHEFDLINLQVKEKGKYNQSLLNQYFRPRVQVK